MGKKRASKSVKDEGLGESNSEVSPSQNKTKEDQPNQYIFWAFTMYDYLEREEQIKEWLINTCKKAVYGHEICPTTQRPHLQGYFQLTKRKRLTEIQNKPLVWSFLKPCYADEYANNKYCTKDGNDIFNHPFKRKPVNLISNFRPFQTELLNILRTSPDDRKILWIYDQRGNTGKTQFCKYMIVKEKACYITSGKTSDIINLVYNYIQNQELNIVLLNLPRDQFKTDYVALEQIKDGIICNTKYETGTIVVNSPHLIIFSNNLPQTEKLTSDRWDIRTIDADFNLIPYQEPTIDELNNAQCPL